MELNTVIFDMDGLLVDSEPLWNEAADEVFAYYGKKITAQEYTTTVGLRTKEFVSWWLSDYKFDENELNRASEKIIETVNEKILLKGKMLPGVHHIINFFHERNFKIGLATSSPASTIDAVLTLLQIKPYLLATTSAEFLDYGKPHPQVYLDCAATLQSKPIECVCFEDSLNGMIAAKAARMKCIVVPDHSLQKSEKWALADLKLSSLQNFNELHFNLL